MLIFLLKKPAVLFLAITFVLCIAGYTTYANVMESISSPKQFKNWSAVGNVSEISSDSISITDVKTSNKESDSSFTLDLSSVERIENRKYIPLNITDILVGDRIIVQGIDDDGRITINRIISFRDATSTEDIIPEVSTSTSITTDDIIESTPVGSKMVSTSTMETSSTTIDVASSTEEVKSSESLPVELSVPENDEDLPNDATSSLILLDQIPNTLETSSTETAPLVSESSSTTDSAIIQQNISNE